MPQTEQTLDPLPLACRELVESADMPGLTASPLDQPLAEYLGTSGELASLPSLAVSGLWLLAGELDRSHELSQHDSSAEGSFWHGVMHRREGDLSNAAYWFRRVGSHDVLDDLADRFPVEHPSADEFIRRVGQCKTGSADEDQLKRIQWYEWERLMRFCLATES